MYPIYRYMDSYPQTCHSHRDQVSYPYPQHPYPSWESPFNGTSRYFSPGDCSGCWNHAYPPAPLISYPHPQVSQHHFHGAYPPCPNIGPAYFIPPPQRVVDQGRSHCCGCPNHSSQKKDDNGLKIEEESPGIEPKNSSSSHMAQWPAYPYPVVCSPPDHMKDNDHKTPKLTDNGSSPMIHWPTYPYPVFWFPPNHVKDNNHEAIEPQGHAPLDRWIPLDKNSLKSLREDEEKKIQSQQNGAKRTQFPLPIIWMPNYGQESEENVRDANASPRVVEDFPPKFRIIPVNPLENENCNKKPGEEDVNAGSQICPTLPDKGRRSKSIPVKHVEENDVLEKLDIPEKEGDDGAEKLSARVKQKEDKQEKKTSDSGTKKQTSPGRSSKLPPVCLRVDPLPGKKAGTSSSRSPSPPGKKEVKDYQETNEGKAGASGRLNESKKDTTVDMEIRVVGVDGVNDKGQEYGTKDVNRVMEVEDGSTSRKEGEEENKNKLDVASTENHAGTGIEGVTGTGKSEDMAKGVENRKCGQLKGSEEVSLGHSRSKLDESKKESGVKNMEENIGRKCKLSETDAVLHIQAAYRGYEVRKWEPLKKLKQIARIRDQVSCIKQQIHNLEISSERGQQDEKQKLIIGETIMNLLLQLDTIQGLHPTVREIRKSVARDLVSEQEKLDILSSKVARGLVHTGAGEASTVGDSENALEEVFCNGTSDSKESFSREECVQTPTEDSLENSLDYSAAEKQEKARELLRGDWVGQNLSPDNKQLISETGNEQTSSPETGLMVRSELENEEQCCSETEEYIKPPTAPEVGLDSMATDVSELPAREHNCTIEEKAQELQQGVQDETGQALGKDESPAGDKAEAEAEAEELHEMQAEVQQPVVNTQPFTATSPVMLEEGEDARQEEEVVPVVEDVMNIQEHEPLHSSESSESPQQCEDSDSRKEALIMHNGETRQVELLHEHLDNYCAEVDDAVSSSESAIQEVDVKGNGGESVTSGYPVVADKEGDAEHPEVDTLDAPAPPYPEAADGEGDTEYSTVEIMDAPVPTSMEVADKESDTEHPNMEIIDATVPTASSRADLVDDDNSNQKMLVEENASKEEENTNSELPGIKVMDMLQAKSTIESECSTEPTSPATVSVDFQVPDTEQASVVNTEHEEKLIEENEKLRVMLEKLLEAGNRQLEMISSLSGRVKDLEKKVAHRRKLRLKQHRTSKSVSCNKLAPKASVESAA